MSLRIIGDELFFDGFKVGDISADLPPSVRASLESYVLCRAPVHWPGLDGPTVSHIPDHAKRKTS